MATHLHPRDEILQAMERIYRYRMTTTSGGNLSIRDHSGDVWITPARLDKGALRRDDIVRIRPDGSIDGKSRPSSELPLHQEIRRRRPELAGIVHAHPVALVAFSLVHRVPNTQLFHQAHSVCGEGGFAPYRLPGSAALGDSVAGTFEQGYNCVVLENHGVVTAGATFQDAFRRFETFEFTAKTIIKASMLGDVRYLTAEHLALERRRTATSEFARGVPTTDEAEIRRTLSEFVHRAYRQRLFISTQGSYSARLSGSSFVITPSDMDRGALSVGDLVLVDDGRHEAGKNPSRAASLHQAIYRRHPGISAIVNAYPVNATAYSVTGTELDTRTIPESYVVARSVGRAPFGLQFEAPDELAGILSVERPAMVLENDGVLVTGGSVLETFDRLEVLESTAEALINCRAIGSLKPLSEDVTRELDEAFFGGC
ncbi:MAG TPA: class II aldolase/adducin family protein [Verrucomicrobiae bacterium]|nr:class II aldolase/adducin family protein [Verrucomicrobiae bacterium]